MLNSLRRLARTVVLLAVAGMAPALAADINYYRPTVVGDGAISASFGKEHQLVFNFLYRNTADQPVSITVSLPDSGAKPPDVHFSVSSNPVAPGQIEPVKVTASGGDVSKITYIDIRGEVGKTHALISSDVRQLKLPSDYSNLVSRGILLGALLCAIVLGLTIWRHLEERKLLETKMGAPNFDLTKSWVSNLAVASALLTAGLAELPDPPAMMAKATYQELSLLFTICVAVAPMFFLALQYFPFMGRTHRLVRCFVFSSLMTVFATLGQLATLGLALVEVLLKAPDGWILGFAVLVVVLLFIGDLFYSVNGSVNQVEEVAHQNEQARKDAEAKAAERRAARRGAAARRFSADDIHLLVPRDATEGDMMFRLHPYGVVKETAKVPVPEGEGADREEVGAEEAVPREAASARWTPL